VHEKTQELKFPPIEGMRKFMEPSIEAKDQ